MSYPQNEPFRENMYEAKLEREAKSPKGKAISKVKAFGSEHNRKSIKRLLKKSKEYRIKHF